MIVLSVKVRITAVMYSIVHLLGFTNSHMQPLLLQYLIQVEGSWTGLDQDGGQHGRHEIQVSHVAAFYFYLIV